MNSTTWPIGQRAHARLRIAALEPGEARSVALFFFYAFALLVCYYLLKLLREPLLLANGSAELKSYASAAIALVLLAAIPAYGALCRRVSKVRLVLLVTAFFAVNVGAFYVLGRAGVDVGFVYYVWVGVFGVTMLAQLWAHAAHSFDVESGQRLFPVIMAGATFGALAGPALFRFLFPQLGPWNLLLAATGLLAITLPLVKRARDAVPARARNRVGRAASSNSDAPGGFRLVVGDGYLLSLAVLAVLLNCVNTTGEYIVAQLVVRHAELALALDPALDKRQVIAAFYGDYYFAVNALTVLLQVAVVARVFRGIGVQGALLVLPAIALVGYGLVAFVPIFSLIAAVKVVENAVDYSVMNTARQAAYLPLPAAHQYAGKTAVDTFFWRLGDLAQAGLVYAGVHWLGFDVRHFALLNLLLALVWIAVAVRVAAHYSRRSGQSRRVWRRAPRRVVAAAAGLATLGVSANVAADGAQPAVDPPGAAIAPLFAADEPLEIELVFDARSFCRDPQRAACTDAPGTIVYRDGNTEQRVPVTIRTRGRWRRDTANCRLPALFLRFNGESTAATPFVGQRSVALTTHCRESSSTYEQYALEEYVAYRIYEQLSEHSLHARLARITYRDAADTRRAPAVRYGFFTEHFNDFAQRSGGQIVPEERAVAPEQSHELEILELFEFMIGNTDWSAVFGHNVLRMIAADGALVGVPFDFDYSGLVDAEYAAPAAELHVSNVRERVFRGFCRADTDWPALFERFRVQRTAIEDVVRDVPGLEPARRKKMLAYLASFYSVLDSPRASREQIVGACRGGSVE
jgi:AAA family ATP:ADP antiporter